MTLIWGSKAKFNCAPAIETELSSSMLTVTEVPASAVTSENPMSTDVLSLDGRRSGVVLFRVRDSADAVKTRANAPAINARRPMIALVLILLRFTCLLLLLIRDRRPRSSPGRRLELLACVSPAYGGVGEKGDGAAKKHFLSSWEVYKAGM